MNKIPAIGVSLFLSLFLVISSAQAQYPGGMGNGGGNRGGFQGIDSATRAKYAHMSVGHVFGKIVDEKTKKGIEFASVALFKSKNDSLITGQLTESNGDFSLETLPFGRFKLKITSLGYAPL